MAHIGIKEHEIRTKGAGVQIGPGLRHVQADCGQLPGQGLHGRMRAVQDDRLRAAKVLNADRALHDTTLSCGVKVAG